MFTLKIFKLHNLYKFINYLRNPYKDFLKIAFLEFKIIINFYW